MNPGPRAAIGGLEGENVAVALPLSWNPAVTPLSLEVAKFAVMSP